ncbi:HAD family hydrolase [Chengkuizengella axinellae]|uniref:HAD-IA family hydrolase n=1 Tax=Chengkuizengella axinellae TaxID=3064388 RepID=A0ABT9IU25_9BACL|nr:HAD-IA family hydrolase [Chengkuizengella sp. 2205SS18-9]MDP5272851.1 HAD-IA family hydrolase [Chengkuizengella sp. 2205SS18-9]
MHKGIIFDLDDTLLDRSKTFEKFLELFIGRYFESLPQSEKNSFMQMIKKIDNYGYTKKEDTFNQLREVLPWEYKPELQELMEFFFSNYVQCAVLMEHTTELLEVCKENNYKLGLVTNGRNQIQYGKIDLLSIRDYFDVIVVSEEAGVKKPSQQIFQIALQRLDLLPHEAIFVGDHPKNDVFGSSQAGMKAIWVDKNQKWDESLKVTPMKTVKKLNELIEYIKDELNAGS